jgi:hypothetical protein
MHFDELEKLRQQYTDQYVLVDPASPKLARFAGIPGQVKSVNMSGLALVQFEGADQGWHDIGLEYLKITEKPAPPPVTPPPPKKAAVAAKKPAGDKPADTPEGS